MEEKFAFRRERQGDVTTLYLKGVIDETTDFKPVFEDSGPELFVDLSGVERINSCGVREWVNAMAGIPADRKVHFVNCSTAMIRQFSMIHNFSGKGEVLSFMGPYYCAECDREVDHLITSRDLLGQATMRAPAVTCPECGKGMEFDEIESKYFHFLNSRLNGDR